MDTTINFRPIIIFAPAQIAGAEKVVINGTNEMHEMGFDPLLVIIQEARNPSLAKNFLEFINPNIRRVILISKKAFDLDISRGITKIVGSEKKIPIVHTHGFKSLVLTKLSRLKFIHVHTHHGNTSHTLKVKFYEFLADLAMRRCDLIISVSDEMTKFLNKKFNPNKIKTIYNMTSLKNTDVIRKYRENLINQKQIQLVYIGRISPEKGLLHFLNIFSEYLNAKLFHLTVLGDGPDKLACEIICQKNNLDNLVTFVGFQKDITQYLKDADMMILPSFTEGMPMTVLEALSIGVPVISTDVGAMKSLISPNNNGIVLTGNSTKEWHESLDLISNTVNKMKEFTLQYSLEFEKQFSSKNWVEKTIKYYQEILNK